MVRTSKVLAAARVAAKKCMGVRPGEKVLVVMEKGTPRAVADAMVEACRSLGANASVASYQVPTKKQTGISVNQSFISTPPPRHLLDAMQASDALFFQSSKSYPAAALQETLKKGVRILATFQLSDDSFARTLLVELESLDRLAKRLARAFSGDKKVVVAAESGTRLAFEHMRGREVVWERYLGHCREPGKMGQLPPGMVATSPREGTGEGVVVVDGAVFGVSKPMGEPLRLRIRNHRIVDVEGGGPVGRALAKELDTFDSNSRTLPSEWGIGLNPGAALGPDIQGETSYGIVHFGVGRNSHVGGGAVESNFHADLMIKAATVRCDGEVLLDSGAFAK